MPLLSRVGAVCAHARQQPAHLSHLCLRRGVGPAPVAALFGPLPQQGRTISSRPFGVRRAYERPFGPPL